MVFVDRDGERHEVKGKVGDNVLYLAHRYGIEMEGDLSLSMTFHHIFSLVHTHTQEHVRHR